MYSEDEDYATPSASNNLLSFIFGNIDDSGELDIDYLDEEAKEHLSALTSELGSSLNEIDLSVSAPRTSGDHPDRGYGKAENAVNYEDIDEDYEETEGEETAAEGHLFPPNDLFLSGISSHTVLKPHTSIFDDEDYDDDEDDNAGCTVIHKDEPEMASPSEGKKAGTVNLQVDDLPADRSRVGTVETRSGRSEMPEDSGKIQAGVEGTEVPVESVEHRIAPLPILCVDRGSVILKFSEIFGIHEPLKRKERTNRPRSLPKARFKSSDTCTIEDDEEDVLRGRCQFDGKRDTRRGDEQYSLTGTGSRGEEEAQAFHDRSCLYSEQADLRRRTDIFRPSQPMKEDAELDSLSSAFCSEVYSLDQCDWEDQIIWDDPALDHVPPIENSLLAASQNAPDYELERFANGKKTGAAVADGTWLDRVIWDSERCSFPNPPKLILDLEDRHMLFEFTDQGSADLHLLAGAIIIAPSSAAAAAAALKSVNSSDSQFRSPSPGGRFNISNDKFYLNRKTSLELHSHSKKRASHGIKALHSIPALKLQTMPPSLRNRDIANFHRPKALWHPRSNQTVLKEQQGVHHLLRAVEARAHMRVLLKNIGGKAAKLLVSADETVSSLKIKASKKLDFRASEPVKIFYSGNELGDEGTLGDHDVRPNSLLHLVRTRIHPLPKAQRLPAENKSLRPPGAFKKKSDLSARDGHAFLMEYCEERPLLLSNAGMGARLCTYYQRSSPGVRAAADAETARLSRQVGTVISLDPADKSPFLGEIKPGCFQPSLETNMFRAPVFPHEFPTTDYLLLRSPKGKLFLRRVDRIAVVGQQEPHVEVMTPGMKPMQTYQTNRLLVYAYREFASTEKRSSVACLRADDVRSRFPHVPEPIVRKRLRHCADLQKNHNGELYWNARPGFRIPLEEELRRMVTPEDVSAFESMQAGLHRLKHMGITRSTNPNAVSSATNQVSENAVVLAAIERELQVTPWNLSGNFVACTGQDRENIERLEISGVGDPTGRGVGFSYVRVAPSAAVKKKTAASQGTNADLRRLSMDAARDVLLKLNVPEEQISSQTRWHRIDMIRKLSSDRAAASALKVDPSPITKFARGQRMSFLQFQQQAREKCQDIWDRQVRSLGNADPDNASDPDENSDLDSFAGDLENLLDAEEADDTAVPPRRHPSEALAAEETEDAAADAAELLRILFDGDAAEPDPGPEKRDAPIDPEFKKPRTASATRKPDGLPCRTEAAAAAAAPTTAAAREKKPARESFVCGACGQLGHMRTNKQCPKYRDEADDGEKPAPRKPFVPKAATTATAAVPVKFKCGGPPVHAEPPRTDSKASRLVIYRKTKPEDETQSQKVSVVIRPPAVEAVDKQERQHLQKKIVIKRSRSKEISVDADPGGSGGFPRMKKLVELSTPEGRRCGDEETATDKKRKRRTVNAVPDADVAWDDNNDDDYYYYDCGVASAEHRRRRPSYQFADYSVEYAPSSSGKRRRGGEVGLANVLERIVDAMKDRDDLSYLFLKPVTRKVAPDYFDVVKRPMDLSKIRDKVRRMEYKSRVEFRNDVRQITFNAHQYNDARNPGIPPLADRLLELCDCLLAEYDSRLAHAEQGIHT